MACTDVLYAGMLFPLELILAAYLALFLLHSYGSATRRSSAM